jgi:hypothetical protein
MPMTAPTIWTAKTNIIIGALLRQLLPRSLTDGDCSEWGNASLWAPSQAPTDWTFSPVARPSGALVRTIAGWKPLAPEALNKRSGPAKRAWGRMGDLTATAGFRWRPRLPGAYHGIDDAARVGKSRDAAPIRLTESGPAVNPSVWGTLLNGAAAYSLRSGKMAASAER